MSEIFTPQNGEDSNDDRPRLVLDTNTVLALWMFRDPKLEALRGWIESGRCRLFSREDALEELRRSGYKPTPKPQTPRPRRDYGFGKPSTSIDWKTA